jgi:hypothetical protein
VRREHHCEEPLSPQFPVLFPRIASLSLHFCTICYSEKVVSAQLTAQRLTRL